MINRRDPLEPTMTIQKEALVAAVSEIIWRAGSGQGILCLPSKSLVHLPESPQFNQDGVTEKVLPTKKDTCAIHADQQCFQFHSCSWYLSQSGTNL